MTLFSAAFALAAVLHTIRNGHCQHWHRPQGQQGQQELSLSLRQALPRYYVD